MSLYIIGGVLVGVIVFCVWMFRQGGHVAEGKMAKSEASKRREDDKIDTLPIDAGEASDIARKLAKRK